MRKEELPPSLQGPEHQLCAGGPTAPRNCHQAELTILTLGEGAETNWKRFHNSGLSKCTVALGWVPKSSLRLCFLLKS